MPTSRAPRIAPCLFSRTLTQLTPNSVTIDLRDALGQRLDQLKLRLADERQQALGDFLVVDRVFDAIAGRGFANVGRHLQIDDHGLLDAPLPFPDADDAFDA